jgi:hypothetical protein
MASRAYWLEKPWIMSADYEGRIKVEDYEYVMHICLEFLEYQPIYFLVDLTQVTAYPLNVMMIPSLIKLVSHPNTSAFAWVGATRFAKTSIPPFVHKPNKFFDDRDIALAYLRERASQERTETEISSQAT